MVLQHSKLLIDDHPLQVLPRLAVVIGLNEAIVLQQVHYWLKHSTVEYGGRKWVYNTYDEWQERNFPFWSTSTIGRIFRKLEDEKFLISRRLNKASYDHTKYYTIDYEHLTSLDIADDAKMTPSEHANLTPSDDTKMTRSTITENTTENTTENGSGSRSVASLLENAFGSLPSAFLVESAADLIDDFGRVAFEAALKTSVEAGKRDLRYVKGILKNDPTGGAASQNGTQAPTYTPPIVEG